jgi:hypothetical protein
MTKTEIYNEFKTIYGNYLGKDFQDPAMLGYFGVNGNVSNGSYFAFVESLESRGVDLGDAEVEKEVKGFGGMSDDEIRVALRARYPETMTLKECILMSRELEGMGLDKSEMGGCFALDIKMILNSQLGGFHDAFNKIYGKMLDMPADYDKMMQNFKAFAANKPEDRHIYLSDSIDDAFEKILVWVGGDADAYSELYDMLKEMEQSGELRYNNAGVLWSTDFPTTDSSERKVTL